MSLTHFDENGNAKMVDVSQKEATCRVARAQGRIILSAKAWEAVSGGQLAKGDVFAVATTAGVMGAKRCFELIPMCHILLLSGVKISWQKPRGAREDGAFEVGCECEVKCEGKTGVEMEALCGVSTALLAFYDMVKAVDKTMRIEGICLLSKSGGKSGDFVAKDQA